MTEAEVLYARLVQKHGDPPVIGGVLLSNALGAGGMGVVFKGLHLRLSIPVAVKVMPAPAEGAPAPLLGEARASARINHPNVVRVYDLGKKGEFFYMIQEYVEGKTAEELVRESGKGKVLSEQTVLSIGCDIARGLAAIHAAGYLHRDVKPGNIIISSKDGVAKLLDLGIARHWDPSPAAQDSPAPRPEAVDGTPGYIAPEHAMGLTTGPASDLYGLGVTIYELLAGRLAYEAGSPSALLTQQFTRELPDIRALRPQLSPATARVVRCCVRLNPEERFSDANTLLNELAKALQALEPPRAAAPATPELPPASVVCVDDDTQVGGMLRDTLEDAGFRVRCYSDPRAGLRGILEEPPDVVITDVHMPDMTGHDVCAAIRAAPSVAEVPVVFLTSDADLGSVGLAVQKGATDYLLKPVNPADLVARVKCLARMAAARRELETLNAQYGAYRNRLETLATKGL
jgi:CheY-like chemotaxis protein